MQCEVTRQRSQLNREVWRFMFIEYPAAFEIKLAFYAEQCRPSTRHRKWENIKFYDAYDNRRNTIPNPPLPDDVSNEARQYFAGLILNAKVRTF